jgi:hypothetical protein
MKFIPYLQLNGNAREAIGFYKQYKQQVKTLKNLSVFLHYISKRLYLQRIPPVTSATEINGV